MKPKPLASLNHFTVPLLTCGVSFQDLYGSAAAPQFGPHTQTAARFPRLRRTTERPTETTRTICSIGRMWPAVKGGRPQGRMRRRSGPKAPRPAFVTHPSGDVIADVRGRPGRPVTTW